MASVAKKPLSPPLSQPFYSTPTTMRRESKAIPIVAPPPTPPLPHSSSSSSSLTNKKMVDSSAPTKNKDVEALLLSFEGKPIHEKKQLLGDKLFPLVKVTHHSFTPPSFPPLPCHSFI